MNKMSINRFISYFNWKQYWKNVFIVPVLFIFSIIASEPWTIKDWNRVIIGILVASLIWAFVWLVILLVVYKIKTKRKLFIIHSKYKEK